MAATAGCLSPRVQRPRSDVPVVDSIGWWPHQEVLCIDDLAVTVVDAPLNLFNNEALVRFQIKGRIAFRTGWRPYINKVQLSQRLSSASSTRPYGDLLLVPVVGVREDSKYTGDDVQFDVTVERLIESLDWGSNRYVVVAGSRRAEFILQQRK